MDKRIKILISCHKEADVLRTECFQPIQVGASVSGKKLPDMLYDNAGENISELNPMYCELTAQYWAWKNLDLDYYGFCHYRRYFNFSPKKYKEDVYGNIVEKYLDSRAVKKYGMDDESVKAAADGYDIIITRRKDIKKIPDFDKSCYEHYRSARFLHIKDFDTMLAVIDEKYPEYSRDAHEFAENSISCFCNMYILKKEIFFAYCEWMFDILEEFCRRTDMQHYSAEALRTPGHLSERLFNIYLRHLERSRQDLKVKELQCVWIENTDPQERRLAPAFSDRSVPVVFAANDRFVPMFAACLQSLIDYSGREHNYDIVLIERDVTPEHKKTLMKMVEGKDNISLRFYAPGRLLRNYKLKANAHISVETYYRFLIQDILRAYDKVLYLDCDTIIQADVADLYETDVEGYMLAAVRDADFLGQINGANQHTIEYLKTDFHMRDPYQYFQAGVLLFNEKEMRKAHSLHEWLTFASTRYMYNDQDVLNLYCEGRVKYLDMSWNLITDCDHTRVKNVVSFAPVSIQKEYAAAHANPKIIHYAGFMKPWHRPSEDYADRFWQTLRKTEFYEELLYRMVEDAERRQNMERERLQNDLFQKAEADHKRLEKDIMYQMKLHMKVLNTFLPPGSNMRQRLDDMYSKIVQKK